MFLFEGVNLIDTKPFLSIVIPIYNAEKYLEECLESVINQDVLSDKYEIICVDDGSTDNSSDIIDDYSKQISNFMAFHQDNSGVSAARNKGIQLARGEYVWFVDADDYIAKNAMLVLFPFINEMLYSRIVFNYFITIMSYKEYSLNHSIVNRLKPRRTDASVCTCIYQKQFLEENKLFFREGVEAGEDDLFNYELNKKNGKQKIIDDALYFNRYNEYSVCNSKGNEEKLLLSHLRCAEIAKQYYDSESKKEIKTVRFLHCELEYAMTLISELSYIKRKEYLQCILTRKLFPFTGIKPRIINIYTNIHSFHLRTVCVMSNTQVFSWRIKLWAKVWNSKIKKNIERKLKSFWTNKNDK